MSWEESKPPTGFTILGDDEGNVPKVGGLLAAIVQSDKYKNTDNYELVQQDGSIKTLAGCTTLASRIFSKHVGKFLKAEFVGWEKGKAGRYKDTKVLFWEGEPTDEMKKWPRWEELNTENGDEPPLDETQAAVHEDETEDDLPF
jgi:hypothetical protein